MRHSAVRGVGCAGCDARPALIDDVLFDVMLTEMDALQSDLRAMQQAAQKPPVYFLENSWPHGREASDGSRTRTPRERGVAVVASPIRM